MRRIIVIVVLCVLMVVLSGCDKIKTELERRHLGTERCKQTALVEKTPDHADDKQNSVETPSVNKQIIIRIDLPSDEKLQIRLIKLPVSEETPNDEEKSNDNVSPKNETSPKETIKEDSLNAENLRNKSENPIESEKKESTEKKEPDQKTPIELETPQSEELQSEIKTDADEEPKSEMKTDREEPAPAVIPAPAPMVIVPARAMASKPILPDTNEKPALSRSVKPNPSPAEAAVESALSVPPPPTRAPAPKEPSNGAVKASKTSAVNPWAIPNEECPLQYY